MRVRMRAIGLGTGLVALVAAQGCQTVKMGTSAPALAVAPSGYVYQSGAASQAFAAPAQEVEKAVVETMAELGIHSVKPTQATNGYQYEGKTVDGRRASVTVDSRLSPPVVTAKFGWFGDEALSRAFMDQVNIHLGHAAVTGEAGEVATPSRSVGIGPEPSAPGLRRFSDNGYRDTLVP